MGLFGSQKKSWPLTAPRPAPRPEGKPLSVIVVMYQMQHQIDNTIMTLLPPYQQSISTEEYEVIVVDNGSDTPRAGGFQAQARNVDYQYTPKEKAPVNPGVAINRAVEEDCAEYLCIMVDGARMLTPGVLHRALNLLRMSPWTIVEVRGWHLGPKLQMESVLEGYNSEVEKKLLDQINWPDEPYRLFEISTPAASMKKGFLGLAAECTCLFLSRHLFNAIGGYDERYTEPGGGLCNADFFVRAVQQSERVFTLLGEGTFHQIHGGAATGLTGENSRESFRRWKGEYEKLSRPWHSSPVDYVPILAGHLPKPARRWLTDSPVPSPGTPGQG